MYIHLHGFNTLLNDPIICFTPDCHAELGFYQLRISLRQLTIVEPLTEASPKR